jgi:hypothetical protein
VIRRSLIHRSNYLLISPGPSYKRGPPKGYIHAIEQRWHQVESLLGAILQCPDARVQEFVGDLKQDGLAREIIDRVDMGPYVSPAFRSSMLDSPCASLRVLQGGEANLLVLQKKISLLLSFEVMAQTIVIPPVLADNPECPEKLFRQLKAGRLVISTMI